MNKYTSRSSKILNSLNLNRLLICEHLTLDAKGKHTSVHLFMPVKADKVQRISTMLKNCNYRVTIKSK